MKKLSSALLLLFCILFAGCDAVRLAPTEAEKQNTWLHNRTAQLSADSARSEDVSERLQELTALSAVQSRAFIPYYGLPKELPAAETIEDVSSQSSWQLASSANRQAANHPDGWQLAEAGLQLAIGIAALMGGVYGTKAVTFLKTAQDKTEALREIIAGNELFKQQNSESVPAFKNAQKAQSPQTRQIVAKLKN